MRLATRRFSRSSDPQDMKRTTHVYGLVDKWQNVSQRFYPVRAWFEDGLPTMEFVDERMLLASEGSRRVQGFRYSGRERNSGIIEVWPNATL